jgi:hypothetical protein
LREKLTIAYPNRSIAECLAANLVKTAIVVAPRDPLEVHRVAESLLAEYHATYGTSAPWSVGQLVELKFLNTVESPGHLSPVATTKARVVHGADLATGGARDGRYNRDHPGTEVRAVGESWH